MRFPAGLGLALALSACGIIPPDSGTGGGGGSTSGSSCDEQDNCVACSSCATEAICRTQLATCQDNSFCLGLDQCIGLCGGMVQCEDDCFAMNSPGANDYVALRECLFCDACPSDCAGQTTCGG
jgi:hypothetical protein